MGCPGGTPPPDPPKNANVSVVLGSNVTSANKAALETQAQEEWGIEDLVASLTVSVTQISLDYAGTEPPSGGPVETFELLDAPIDVDLFHLDTTGLSLLLAGAELPAGYYTALHILFENPRLVLQTDPDNVVLDLSITAQGELTIDSVFQLPEGDSILVLDIGGIHFSFDSNGALVLIINLSAEVVGDDDTEVEVCGVIDAVHPDLETFEMSAYGDFDKNSNQEPVNLVVEYGDAEIYLPNKCDTPTGTPEDLVVGANVKVEGTMTPEGTVHATKIMIKEVEDDTDEVKALGVIDAVHPDLDNFEMSAYVEYTKNGGEQDPVDLLVQYGDADIYLPTDGDTPTGTEADLVAGLEVKVYGTLTEGTVVAYKVRIRGPEGSEPVQKAGEIDAVHLDLDKFELSVGDHDYLVLYGSAGIYLPTDGDTPTGTEADLAVGAEVLVIGMKTPDHVITASAVKLLNP
ncbi:MAG: DUF5666 domain-containing protein [Candidatus Hydrogenedentales bacterium]|jgi:hypothetical protein